MTDGSGTRSTDSTTRLPTSPVGLGSSSFRAQIYTDLRNRLQRAEFAPGHRLVDTEVAAEFRTSRMPAREALMALMSQGFLHQTSRGFVVPSLTVQDVRDIFHVRKLLEPEAAALAVGNLDAAGHSALKLACDLARKARATKDFTLMMEANNAARGTWLSAVGNPRLVETIESFRDHIQAVRVSTLHLSSTLEMVLEEMENLTAAFLQGEPEAARKAALRFMEAAENQYFKSIGTDAEK